MNVFMRAHHSPALWGSVRQSSPVPLEKNFVFYFAKLITLATVWKSRLCFIIKLHLLCCSHSSTPNETLPCTVLPYCGWMTFSVICLFACKSISVITGESFAVCCLSIIVPLLLSRSSIYTVMASESGIVPLWEKRDVFLTHQYGDGEMECHSKTFIKATVKPWQKYVGIFYWWRYIHLYWQDFLNLKHILTLFITSNPILDTPTALFQE